MKKDIYLITNKINHKKYVGQAKNTKTRFQSHCKPSAAYLNHELIAYAIQKYGKENFTLTILENQIDNYDEREKYWIKFYNTQVPNGYNIQEGGSDNFEGLKGIWHPESILTQEQVENLTIDLKTSKLTYQELAEKYNFSSKTSIYDFNNGKTYAREEIDYPIRKEAVRAKLSQQDISDIIEMLKYTYRSFESIGKQYQVEARTISRINRGIYHRQENEYYPIRIGKNGNTLPKFTYEDVTKIIMLLLDTDLSLREIARQFNCRYENILGIKNGSIKLYRRATLIYPLRKNN